MTAVELELSRLSGPYLNWKISSKGRQRTIRQPRTSFTGLIFKQFEVQNTKVSQDTIEGPKRITRNKMVSAAKRRKQSETLDNSGQRRTRCYRKKTTAKIFEQNQDLTDKEPKRDQDISVFDKVTKRNGDISVFDKEPKREGEISISESEKLGVTLLGRRFTDMEKFVPIKKRRIFLDPSTFPFESDASANRADSCQGKYASDFNRDIENIKEVCTEIADFSGMSLLASAACSSSIADDVASYEDSKPPCVHIKVEQGINDEKMEIPIKSVCKVELVGAKQELPDSTEFKIIGNALLDSKLPVTPVLSCESTSKDHGEEEVCPLISHVGGSYQDECQLDSVPIVKFDISKETCSSVVGDTLGTESVFLVNTSTPVDTWNLQMGPPDTIQSVFCHTSATVKESAQVISHYSSSLPEEDQRTKITIPAENKDAVSVYALNLQAGGCDLIEVETHVDSNASICTDPKIAVVEPCATVNHLAEEALYPKMKRDSSCRILACTGGIYDEVSQIGTLDISGCDQNVSPNLVTSFLCDPCPSTCLVSLNHDELSCGSTSVTGDLPRAMDKQMKCNDFSHVASKNSAGYLAVNAPAVACAPPTDDPLGSFETYKSCCESLANCPGDTASGDHACSHDIHASQTGSDQVFGQGKDGHLSDDDYQYEDGEIRGSAVNGWGEDEVEGETQLLDYGSESSDNREMDVETADHYVDNIDIKDKGLLEVGYANRDVLEACSDTQSATPQTFLKDTSVMDTCDTERGKVSARNSTQNGDRTEMHLMLSEGSSGSGETLRSSSLSFEKEQFPENSRSIRDGIMDSGVDPAHGHHTPALYNASGVSKSMRSTGTLHPRSSKIERSKLSNNSNMKERYYATTSGRDDSCDQNFDFGDDKDDKYFRRWRQAQGIHSRCRQDDCVYSHHHRFDSSGYCSPNHFRYHSPKNAFVAVAANLEKNGFVIAPDGTILKAGGHLMNRTANASSQRTNHLISTRPRVERGESFGVKRGHEHPREMAPERHTHTSRIRIDSPEVARMRHMENYLERRANHEPLYRMEQSSPRRGPLHPSRHYSRSPSRSRPHSPTWRHPSVSVDHGMDMKSGIRWCGRSPFLNSEVMDDRTSSRMQERSRSPHRPPGYKFKAGYTPSARNHSFSLHTSRRLDENNALPDQYKERPYKRTSEGQHARGFPQDQKLNCLESQGSLKPNKDHHPLQSGRFPDSSGVVRKPRYHNTGNPQSHSDGREVLHLTRQCDIDGVEDLQNDECGTVCNL